MSVEGDAAGNVAVGAGWFMLAKRSVEGAAGVAFVGADDMKLNED